MASHFKKPTFFNSFALLINPEVYLQLFSLVLKVKTFYLIQRNNSLRVSAYVLVCIGEIVGWL